MSVSSRFRSALAGLFTAGAVLVGLGADDAPTKHVAGELSFEAPASFKSEKPKSAMRKAQFKLAAVEGDSEPAELVITAFPNGAGTVEANIARWAGQFKNADGETPKPEVKVVEGKNVKITRVEVGGRYVAPVFPGSSEVVDKPNFRLFGAIVQTDEAGYFFKMVGPDKTMKSGKDGFDSLLKSIKKD